ncbi:MAG TPA: hypothetical protein DCZ75_15405 [Geobacter sp.]|nr:hypothetical protein [Geobacter sp.]
MPKRDDIQWFKQQFAGQIESAVSGTPFCLDMVTAIACQETGNIWSVLRRQQLDVGRILELCVGDTLDTDRGRKAFPRTKEELISKRNGAEMFEIAHKALVEMAQYIEGYRSAAANKDKFCHGFGIFQYDLQFFLGEPDYFMQKRYADFGSCLEKCIVSLRGALARVGWQDKETLTEYEKACVAIAYNAGGFIPSKGLKQGYWDGTKYYGEAFFEYFRLCREVPPSGPVTEPPPGRAPVAPPSPVLASGTLYEVDVRSDPLRLRSEPEIDPRKPGANVLARLPDGQVVRAVSNKEVNGFLEVETSLNGARYRGFAAARYLVPASGPGEVPVPNPAPVPPTTGIVAVNLPSPPGKVTRRTEAADAHSLNEPGQPDRKGATAGDLRSDIAGIIRWLAVDAPAHLRYQPRQQTTFCNIYAHDFCHLAGAYLPRVWWTPGAIERLAVGEQVRPLLNNTVEEQRANDLFRWLRDFGIRFGWRQTGSLTKLQLEVNQGALGVIVARRREDARPGHVVVVVPETNEERARRNGSGDVVAPLQSQAGSRNFRYGTGRPDWWKGDQFADSGFWLHL